MDGRAPEPGDESLPSRERGLKSAGSRLMHAKSWSLPSRERGLKYTFKQAQQAATRRSLHGSVD